MTSNNAKRSRMQQLGDYVTSVRFSSLPLEVVWRAKMITLANLGCALLGSSLSGSPALAQSVDVLGGGHEATIALQSPRGASVFSAAVVNSTYIGKPDLSEGVSRGGVHPGVVLVPAALAEGERLHCSGSDYLSRSLPATMCWCAWDGRWRTLPELLLRKANRNRWNGVGSAFRCWAR